MLKGKNLLILALVAGGAYWYWNKMKKDKAAQASGSTNFTGDLDVVDYQNVAGKVPTKGIKYGGQFNRATDVSGVQYYVPSVNASGEPMVDFVKK